MLILPKKGIKNIYEGAEVIAFSGKQDDALDYNVDSEISNDHEENGDVAFGDGEVPDNAY